MFINPSSFYNQSQPFRSTSRHEASLRYLSYYTFIRATFCLTNPTKQVSSRFRHFTKPWTRGLQAWACSLFFAFFIVYLFHLAYINAKWFHILSYLIDSYKEPYKKHRKLFWGTITLFSLPKINLLSNPRKNPISENILPEN